MNGVDVPWVRLVAAASFSALVACGNEPSGGSNPTPDGGAPSGAMVNLLGLVQTPSGEGGFHRVPGARVTLSDGRLITADSTGAFLAEVPAGVSQTLQVEGPAPGGVFGDERYGSTRVEVVVGEGGANVVATLLAACSFAIDAAGGGTLTDEACAGGGAVSLDFPADAFVRPDGSAYAGSVRIDATVVDPEHAEDLLSLPAPEGPDGAQVLGAVEVRLFDARGEPLELAPGVSVPVRFEIGAPESDDAEPPRHQWFDVEAGAWVDDGDARIEASGDRMEWIFEATHFSRYRSAASPPRVRPPVCLRVRPIICDAAGDCEQVGATATVYGSGFAYTDYVSVESGFDCVSLPARRLARVALTYANPLATTLLDAPVYQHTFVQPALSGPSECGPGCEDAGRQQLFPVFMGCVNTTLVRDDGDPVTGVVRVRLGGEQVAVALMPPACGGEVCTPVPITRSATNEVTIRDTRGYSFTFRPSQSSAGRTCPRAIPTLPDGSPDPERVYEQFCSGAGGCEALGSVAAACTAGEGCLLADFRSVVRPGAGPCTGDEYLLELDATPTSGRIGRYEWRIERLDAEGVPPILRAGPDVVTTAACVEAGRYRVHLVVLSDERLSRRSDVARTVLAQERLPGPCIEERDDGQTCTWSYDDDRNPTTRACVRDDIRTTYTFTHDVFCGVGCATSFPFQTVAEITRMSPTFMSVDRYRYNDWGNITEVRRTGDAANATRYRYDDDRLPTVVEIGFEQPDGSWSDWAVGALIERTGARVDAQETPGGGHRIEFTYGAGDRIERMLSTFRDGGGTEETTYDYDPDGNLSQITFENLAGTVTRTTFTYDCW